LSLKEKNKRRKVGKNPRGGELSGPGKDYISQHRRRRAEKVVEQGGRNL